MMLFFNRLGREYTLEYVNEVLEELVNRDFFDRGCLCKASHTDFGCYIDALFRGLPAAQGSGGGVVKEEELKADEKKCMTGRFFSGFQILFSFTLDLCIR